MRKATSLLGVEPHIRWMEAVPAVYSAADVMVNFPDQDSLTATLQEAAACERPFISALLPEYRGTFVEKYGRMVAPGDLGGLADAICAFQDVKTSEPLRLASRQARECVVRLFDERLHACVENIRRGRSLRPCAPRQAGPRCPGTGFSHRCTLRIRA